MCSPASFIVTKPKVFWSTKSDSHEDIIKEFELVEIVHDKITFVRVEITPPDNDFNAPLKTWTFKTDQDILPDWYDAKDAEKRVRAELKKWLAARVVLRGQERNVNAGEFVYIASGGKATLRGNSQATLQDDSQATLRDDSHATLQGNSLITTYHELPKSILQSKNTAMIYRHDGKVECFVGKNS